MSGLKYSQIEMEREKKAQADERQRLERLAREFQVAGRQIEKLQAALPAEVIAAFPEAAGLVREWQALELTAAADGMNSRRLREVADAQASGCELALAVVGKLVEIRERGRDEAAASLSGRVEICRNRLEARNFLLEKWQPGETDKGVSELDRLSGAVAEGQFISVREGLTRFESHFTGIDEKVTELESLDRQRQTVLEALLEVCQEMGWEAEAEAGLENAADPASALRFTVDTFSAGSMQFRLTLEGIQVDAPFAGRDRLCYRQFDDLSEKLKKYGIKTGFKRVDAGDDLPEDRTSDALDMEEAADEDLLEV